MTRSLLLLRACLLFASWRSATAAVLPLRVNGLIAAAFTPYHSNSTLNLAVVPSQAEYLKRTGAKGVFVGGTTGDSVSLTISERKSLAEAWSVATKEHGLLFIVHVGAEALGDVVELAQHASQLRADAIGCMPSVYFKPATVDALAQWLQHVSRVAPTLPLYYYHIPSMTGVTFLMLELLEAVDRVGVPTFAGVKYTGLYENQAFPDLQRSLRYRGGRYEVLSGREEMTVEALSVGARGFIGSSFNCAADLYVAIGEAWPNITRAGELQMLVLDFFDVFMNVPAAVNGLRMVMQHTSVQVGPARLPSLQPDDSTVKAVSSKFQSWCIEAKHTVGTTLKMCESLGAKIPLASFEM